MDSLYAESVWYDIEGAITLASSAARLNAKNVADSISYKVEHEYPDINVLREEFDSGNYTSPKFTQIIIDSIKDKYLFDIPSRNNDIFVMYRNGIVVDMNVNKFNRVQRGITEESNSQFNPELAFNSLEAIISRDTHYNLFFYEPQSPEHVTDHNLITNPSLEHLKEVYQKEGIEGLQSYNILVPVYITDDGDLFGTPDIGPDGSVNLNHKMIVVQRFSIYDIVKSTFNSQLYLKHRLQEHIVQHIGSTKNFYSVAFMAMILLDIVLIGTLFIYSTTPPKE
jgi:hypothetical protein